jgi:hypothetical protein
MKRRSFLRTLGGTGVVLAATGIGLSQCNQMPAEALVNWSAPGAGEDDPRRWALAHALLAPNPHNMQPWIADLRQPDVITLLIDQSRLLPETDPFGRQIVIGCGCFLEILEIAARERGYDARISVFPDGEGIDRPVARIAFRGDPATGNDDLFSSIVERRSAKVPYDPGRPVSNDHWRNMAGSIADSPVTAAMAAGEAEVVRVRDIAKAAMATELATTRTFVESIERMRIDAADILRHRDGISLPGPFFWWLKRLGVFDPENAVKPDSMGYQGGIDHANEYLDGTPSFGWIKTTGNSRHDQIAAGRAYVRVNLAATAQGVAMHPVSQALQEFTEMVPHFTSMRSALGVAGDDTVQMLFRLGYATPSPHTPRRPIDDLIRS